MKDRTSDLLLLGVLTSALWVVGCGRDTPRSGTAQMSSEPATRDAEQRPEATEAAGKTSVSAMALGKQLFDTGIGRSGRHLPFSGGTTMFRRASAGCAYCHGTDGRGLNVMMVGMTPAVNYAALRSPADGQAAMYSSDEQLKQPIMQGLNEDGEPLKEAMPRWQMGEQDFLALVAHLKVLDDRPGALQRQGGGMMDGR